MSSSSAVPWYNRPPREFPVHIWMRKRYGFRVPPHLFSSSQPEGPRPFPAKVWLEQQLRQ